MASTTPTCATRSATGSSTRSGRRSRSAAGARRRPTSPTSTIARPSRAAPSRCSPWSTTPARRASTSRSTPTRTSGRAPGSSSSCRCGSRQAGPGRLRSASPTRRSATALRTELRARGACLRRRRRAAGHPARATSRRPEHLRWEGRTSATSWPRRGARPVDLLCDLLVSEDLRVNQVTPGPTATASASSTATRSGWSARTRRSSATKPSPRTYGSFPRILGQFVRDEPLLGLEEAVHKMTSAPAARLGPARPRPHRRWRWWRISSSSTRRRSASTATYDEPRPFPAGSSTSSSTERPVVERGVHTGATPGRALRQRPRLRAHPTHPARRAPGCIESAAMEDGRVPDHHDAGPSAPTPVARASPGRSRPARARAGCPAPARGSGQAHRRGEIHRRPRLSGRLVRRHDPLDRRPRAPHRARPRPRLRLVDGRRRDRGRHPGREHRRLDQGRPADPRPDRRRDPPSCRAAGPARRGRPRHAARCPPSAHAPSPSRSSRSSIRSSRTTCSRDYEIAPRRFGRRSCRRRLRPRGRVPGRPPGAALHREQRHDRGARPRTAG